MRPSDNLKNTTPSDTYQGVQLVSSTSQFFWTTTEIQSGPGAFDKSKYVVTFLTILGVMEILCSFRVVLGGKTGILFCCDIRYIWLHFIAPGIWLAFHMHTKKWFTLLLSKALDGSSIQRKNNKTYLTK